MWRIAILCLSVTAAWAEPIHIDKSVLSKLPGKRVEMGMKEPVGSLPSFVVNTIADAKSLAEWQKSFGNIAVPVDFTRQKLIYVVPFGSMDALKLRATSLPELTFCFEPVTHDAIAAQVTGHMFAVDKALSDLKIELLAPSVGGLVKLRADARLPEVEHGRHGDPGRVLVDKQLLAKLPGTRVEIKPGRFVVGEITDAKSELLKQLRGPAPRVDFARQKLIYVVPVSAEDELRPFSAQLGPELAVVSFRHAPLTNYVAHADAEGSLLVVDKQLGAVAIDLLETHTQRVALSGVSAR